MKALTKILAALLLALSAQSCLLFLAEELPIPPHLVAWEPYARFTVVKDGETIEYVDKMNGGVQLVNSMGFSKNNGDRGIRFDAYLHEPFEMYISITDPAQKFKTETTYWPRELNILNRYGHLCTFKDGNVRFHQYREKSYDLFELTFECTLVDPDSGYLIFLRSGKLTVCKNAIPNSKFNLDDFLSL